MSLKTIPMSVEEAVFLADKYMELSKVIEEWEDYPQDFSVKDKVKNISRRIIKDSILIK